MLLVCEPVRSQTAPPDILPDRDPQLPQEERRPTEIPTAPDLLPERVPAPLNLPDSGAIVTPTAFIFTGNTRFSDAELAAKFTDRLLDRPLKLFELLQVAVDIAQHYQAQGYATSGAVVRLSEATQTQRRGSVEIVAIEGELERIDVFPLTDSRLSEHYIRSRIAIATDPPLNIPRLREALQLLQLDPRIETVSATLLAGSEPGQSILEIGYRPAQHLRSNIVVDNGRVPSVGSLQRGALLSHDNLLGFGDSLGFSYSNSDGSHLYDLRYSIPLNPQNGTLGITFSYNQNNVIEPPFDELDIETESQTYELILRQPIARRLRQQTFQEIAIGFIASWRDSEASLENEPFALSPGAEVDGETHIFALRFFQDYTRSTARDIFALRSQFSIGLDAFGATTNEQIEGVEQIPDSRFFSWQGQAQYARSLGRDSLLLLRSNVQLADRTLLAAEQYSLGGINTVRGYRQDQLLTDNGIYASAEIRLPIARTFSRRGVLLVAPFFDWGTTWNSSDVPDRDPNTLSSVGIGLLWQYEDTFSARLDWGIPLVEVDGRDRTLQEDGILFSIQFSPF